jgi:hypothetical protein
MGWNAQEAVRQRFAVTRLLGDMDKLYRELVETKAIHLSQTPRVSVGDYKKGPI